MTLTKTAALTVCLSFCIFAQQPKESPEQALPANCSVETITTKVEKVFKGDVDGYQFNSYLITYRGKQVIVEDPIISSNHSIGDDLKVIVVRNDMSKTHPGGKKLISFIVSKMAPNP
jgi:hypothetical protein